MSTAGSADYVLLTRLADEFAARYRAGERPALQGNRQGNRDIPRETGETGTFLVIMRSRG